MSNRVHPSARSQAWVGTSAGYLDGGLVSAHAGSGPKLQSVAVQDRTYREEQQDARLHPAATRASGAGDRLLAEEPDRLRTCFERDRDRIVHSSAFRRLAGKTQVFVHPADHQRTRLTHALEVTQVAGALARSLGLNVDLTEAIALGHDCGHGPGGHASEEAFDAYLPEGFDHAPWGADVALSALNLCAETLDGIRNHSWSRPSPLTPEGAVVSWADRIAYTAHDLEDAIRAGILQSTDIPPELVRRCGGSRREQINTFITELLSCAAKTGTLGMRPEVADDLAALRTFNYERIYTRPQSLRQTQAVVAVLQALVEHYAQHPQLMPEPYQPSPEQPNLVRAAVTYVSGMTDRFAFTTAVRLLGWPVPELPEGIDVRAAT